MITKFRTQFIVRWRSYFSWLGVLVSEDARIVVAGDTRITVAGDTRITV